MPFLQTLHIFGDKLIYNFKSKAYLLTNWFPAKENTVSDMRMEHGFLPTLIGSLYITGGLPV